MEPGFGRVFFSCEGLHVLSSNQCLAQGARRRSFFAPGEHGDATTEATNTEAQTLRAAADVAQAAAEAATAEAWDLKQALERARIDFERLKVESQATGSAEKRRAKRRSEVAEHHRPADRPGRGVEINASTRLNRKPLILLVISDFWRQAPIAMLWGGYGGRAPMGAERSAQGVPAGPADVRRASGPHRTPGRPFWR